MFYNLYQACQNKFLIVVLERDFHWQGNSNFRRILIRLGKANDVDSILILTGNPWRFKEFGYHCTMEVFEPRADSISTMCGNGVRAICQFWIDNGFLPNDHRFLLKTDSGLREVFSLGNNLFRVNVGLLSVKSEGFAEYINHLKGMEIDNVITGTTGDINNGKITGEPHLIFFLKKRTHEKISLRRLKEYTTNLGKIFTQNQKLFPGEINTSVGIQNLDDTLSLCTYERGVYYVTKSCGTAAAVAGGYLMKKYDLKRVNVNNLGGRLLVEIGSNGNIYLTGDASLY